MPDLIQTFDLLSERVTDIVAERNRLRAEVEALRTQLREAEDGFLDTISRIEGEIAADPRHFKNEVMGAHMLGASVRVFYKRTT